MSLKSNSSAKSPAKSSTKSPVKSPIKSSAKSPAKNQTFIKPFVEVKKQEKESQNLQAVIPEKPKDPELIKFWEQLNVFCQSKNNKFDFENDLDSNQRKTVHDLAEQFNLEHFSVGSGQQRHLQVEKKSLKPSQWQLVGYLGLFGNVVDQYVPSNLTPLIPSSAIDKRKQRDGSGHHITLISPPELQILMEQNDLPKLLSQFGPFDSETEPRLALISAAEKQIQDDLECHGIGKITHSPQEVWFLVFDWPSAQEFRAKLKLPPKDFHATLGFTHDDVHDIPKNKSTLIKKD